MSMPESQAPRLSKYFLKCQWEKVDTLSITNS